MLNVKGKSDLLKNCSGKRRNDDKESIVTLCLYMRLCRECLETKAMMPLYLWCDCGMSQGCPLSESVAASFGSTALLSPPHSVSYYSLIYTSC